MLQNIIINKSGSESDDGQKILFSSPTSWEPAGENLIVYKNNQIITNYTVIDANTIKLATKAVVSDNFQLVITQIIDPSGLYSEDDRMHQVDAIYKKMQGKAKTSIQKRYTEETLASNLHMHSQDIWVSPIVVDPQQAANQSVATLHTLSLLAEDLTVPNHLGWNSNITDWIPPRYGKSYIVRIYDRNGAEIPSSDPMGWDFDYQAGYLSIKNSFTYATPLKITGYQYVGKYGVGELTNWKDPVFDIKSMPLLNNLDGDLRLVLDENRIYRFDGGLNKWDKLEYGSDRFKDPVATKSLLPAQAITGDITLVLDENNLYVWADQWLLLTGRSFSPDDYYEKKVIDAMMLLKSNVGHLHDDIYYRKEKVDSLVRWRTSVASFPDLPPFTENLDGDVILTRDSNSIYRWYTDNPNVGQGHWAAILQSNFSWKGPVALFTDLPPISNTVGDCRLVESERKIYLWDGTHWLSLIVEAAPHNHDDRYFLKTETFWKMPASSFAALPTLGNSVGDVRLVLSENSLYRYDGTAWFQLTANSTWLNPVNTILDLPAGKQDQTIFVRQTGQVYYFDTIWKPIELKAHDHNDLYFTKAQVSNLIQTHTHNGVDSLKINYGDLINTPILTWKDPVLKFTDLMSGTAGDARIVMNETALYIFYGGWKKVSGGAYVHNHDDLYYSKALIDQMLNQLMVILTAQIAGKADLIHTHDDRYFTRDEVTLLLNNKADLNHVHPQYETITNLTANYYSKTDLQTSGSAQVHWDNVIHKPTDTWRTPVQTTLPLTGNQAGDLRLILDTSNVFRWDGTEWLFVGKWQGPELDYWKEPANTLLDLPTISNADGDIRLVITENKLYRWDQLTLSWIPLMGGSSSGSGSSGAVDPTIIQVYLNGQYLTYLDDWTVDGNNNIKVSRALTSQDVVSILVLGEPIYRRNYRGDANPFPAGAPLMYWRKEIYVSAPTAAFAITEPYNTGTNSLILWVNGILQHLTVDYLETNAYTFTFNTPLVMGDTLSIMVLGTSSGNNDFVREDFQVSIALQRRFTLAHNYTVGQQRLMVFLNGQLLVVNEDYIEIDLQTVLITRELFLDDLLTFFFLMDAGSYPVGTTPPIVIYTGSGNYTREDNPVQADLRSQYRVEKEFLVGTKQLLVFINGQLMQPNSEYVELDNHTVEFLWLLRVGDLITFIILEAGAGGSGGGGGSSSAKILLDSPSDGTWTDGYCSLSNDTTVADAIDNLNESLLEFVPDVLPTLDGSALSCSVPQYNGFISDGNTVTENGVNVFENYLMNTGSFVLSSIEFSEADRGKLFVYINDVLADSFDLGGAFVESNRNVSQSIASYGIQGNGASANVGIAGNGLRVGLNLVICVKSIGKYEYKRVQQGKIDIRIFPNLIHQGFNQIRLVQQINNVFYNALPFKFFFDVSNIQPSLVGTHVITERTLNSAKYVSGVRYYTIGDRFRINFNAQNPFHNVYVVDPVVLDFPGLTEDAIEYNDVLISGVSPEPHLNDSIAFVGDVILNKTNDYSIDARLSITTKYPFGNGLGGITDSESRLINTWVNPSTLMLETFFDEQYRLPDDPYITIPVVRNNAWNSHAPLSVGHALVFDGGLRYANINFSDFLPVQTADYSQFGGNQTWFRSFYSNKPCNHSKLNILGITLNDLIQKNIIIDIKLPASTGWLSLNRWFDATEYDGSDGDGCLVDVEGNDFFFSTGNFSTAYSDFILIIRVTLPNDLAPIITRMEWII